MAELTYDDVRRAAQEAVRDLQGIVSGLRTSSEDIRRTLQQSGATQSQYQLNDLLNKLNMLQNQIAGLDNNLRGQTSSVQTLQTLQQNMNDIQRRLAAMEEFVHFIYRYFNAMQQRTEDDQGYRGL